MSTENPAVEPRTASAWWDQRAARSVRLSVATVVTLAIAHTFNWPLAFVAPVLVASLLAIPLPEPGLREFLANAGYSVLAVAGGFLLVLLLEPFPLAFLLAYALAIFLIAYFLNKGALLAPCLVGLIGLLAFPVFGNIHEGVTAYLACSVGFSAVLALVMVQLAYGLIPDPPGSEKGGMPAFQRGYMPHAARGATLTVIVVAPLMTAFLYLNWTSNLLVLIYAGIMSLQGNLAHGLYDLKKYLIATAIGGSVAVPFYLLIVAVPEFHFFLLLALLVLVLMGARRFSASPLANYYGSAICAFIILISSSLGAGADLDVNIVKRAAMIFLGGVYVVVVLSIAEPIIKRIWPLKEVSH
jgi:hypothetical protein